MAYSIPQILPWYSQLPRCSVHMPLATPHCRPSRRRHQLGPGIEHGCRYTQQQHVGGQRRQHRKVAMCSGAVPAPQPVRLTIPVGGQELIIETGEIGRQASGAVTVTLGETVVYTTACADSRPSAHDFLPLTVHYVERMSAAGKTTGGYLKRERGRPKDAEVLTARLVDRPLRPMFAEGWRRETQVLSWLLSYDGENQPEPLAITAAGAALAISDIPLTKAVAGVRVGLLPWAEGEAEAFVVNPTAAQMEGSRLDLMVAGTADAVLMIEGFCDFLSEEQMLEAVRVGSEAIAVICRAVQTWAEEVGKPKQAMEAAVHSELESLVAQQVAAAFTNIYQTTPGKQERAAAVDELRNSMFEQHCVDREGGGTYPHSEVATALKHVEARAMRDLVLSGGARADGRGVAEVRPIWSRAGVLPRTHGSALFTRGETQVIAVTTLGNAVSAQRMDSVTDAETVQRFLLSYTFPPSSVGEVKFFGGPGRREIGHGQLAERALLPCMPEGQEWPYVTRVESTVTESNGSSSMASVCGGCLSLLDAGVPLRAKVAGVAMGLILEPDGRYAVLTDILGSEDALGDMDFKVAGSEEGITAFQMDIKVEGITLPVMADALAQAKVGRRHILEQMERCSPPPANKLSPYAPRLKFLQVPPERLGALLGSGGKGFREIEKRCGAEKLYVADWEAGTIEIQADTDEIMEATIAMVQGLTQDPEPGAVYMNVRVEEVKPFGAFVEFLPGRTGLIHVSELDVRPINDATKVFQNGDIIDRVVLLNVLPNGKIALSRRQLMEDGDYVPEPGTPPATPPPRAFEPEIGRIYRNCKVVRLEAYGAFVELVPNGPRGLIHVSELDTAFVRTPADVLEIGQPVDVFLAGFENGKMKLSRRVVLETDAAAGDDGALAADDADIEELQEA